LKSDKPIGSLSDEEISHALDFANATGSLVTSKKGAIPAIPTLEEIQLCMKNTKKLSV
jgi:fructokinase